MYHHSLQKLQFISVILLFLVFFFYYFLSKLFAAIFGSNRSKNALELGTASINLNSPKIYLSQLIDDQTFAALKIKINSAAPLEIIMARNLFNAPTTPSLLTMIRNNFPRIKLVPIDTHHFNERNGVQILDRLCVNKLKSSLPSISKKPYALAAANALLTYVQVMTNNHFAEQSLNVIYRSKLGVMMIGNYFEIYYFIKK